MLNFLSSCFYVFAIICDYHHITFSVCRINAINFVYLQRPDILQGMLTAEIDEEEVKKGVSKGENEIF